MRVEDVCRKNVIRGGPDDTVRNAAKQMKQLDVGSIVVVDSSDQPIGMVTDRDIVQRVIRRRRDPDTTKLREIMSRDIVSVWSGAPLARAFHRMRQEETRRVLVTDEVGRVIGIIAVDDAIPLITNELQTISDVLAAQGPNREAPSA
ncbi:MAG: CBS domain-containing protein [Deltaproteobacteria bacterium]|nr:CBS domain-containing protein [Deltaproteobacteria bacterium]